MFMKLTTTNATYNKNNWSLDDEQLWVVLTQKKIRRYGPDKVNEDLHNLCNIEIKRKNKDDFGTDYDDVFDSYNVAKQNIGYPKPSELYCIRWLATHKNRCRGCLMEKIGKCKNKEIRKRIFD